MSKTVRHLTGITTTGTPHLGNYVGAIRPAILASRRPGTDAFFFLADYHALVKCDEPERVQRSRLEIAATWLACGLDPERVVFYRQSDIPEIPELTWLLTCVTAKGLMNRAHAYKAAVDANVAEQQDPDAGISMGLFSYPILMAADILMFNAHRVPVGRDQVQHIEMARDIAQRFNNSFGRGHELFVLPEADVEESVATLPGLDGRKMSKSYDNTIPLFEGGAKGLREGVFRIVTDSRLPGEPKDADGAALFTLYRAFASADETQAMREALEQGLGWGEAKQRLYDRLETELAPLREHYDALMARPDQIEQILQHGARNARAVAGPLLARLREAVGLRAFRPAGAAPAAAASGHGADPSSADRSDAGRSGAGASANATGRAGDAAPAQFKQYREPDGRFYFKLVDSDGRVLLQSTAFEAPREAGQLIARLRRDAGVLRVVDDTACVDGTAIGTLGEGVPATDVTAALARLAAADAEAAAAGEPPTGSDKAKGGGSR